jgi:Sideroflexins
MVCFSLAGEFALYCLIPVTISGIDVYPPSDNGEKQQPIGKSSRAGTLAIAQTAASRVLTNMCVAHAFSGNFLLIH